MIHCWNSYWLLCKPMCLNLSIILCLNYRHLKLNFTQKKMSLALGETYTHSLLMPEFFQKMELLRQEHFAIDLIIHCLNGEQVFAHKIVLATRFPKLQRILPTAHTQISNWSNYSAQTLNKMIEFAYTGSIYVDTSNAMQIFLLSLALGDNSLKAFCQNFMNRRSQDIFITGRNANYSEGDVQVCKFNSFTRSEEILGIHDHWYFDFFTDVALVKDHLFFIGCNQTNHITSFNVITRRDQLVAQPYEPNSGCAIASSNRELLLCGGCGLHLSYNSSCQVLNVAENRWQNMPKLQVNRASSAAIWLPTGEIFVMGGSIFNIFFNTVEFFIRHWDDNASASESWKYVAPILKARANFGAVSFLKSILIAGGNCEDGELLNSAEIFTPANESGQWTEIQPMQTALSLSSCVVSNAGVLVFSGYEKTKIQRLNPNIGENIQDWKWDELDSPHSVEYGVHGISIK